MLILILSMAAVVVAQDPPGTAAVPPAARSAEQAQVDVCLYTPVENRAPSCEPLLMQEARLVPDEAFARADPSSLGWASIACAPDRLAEGQSRTDCRADQRALFRRAERARQALASDAAPGIMADSAGYTVGPATSAEASDALALNGERRQVGENCERRASSRRDQDTGDSSSSHSIVCSWGSGDGSAAREVLDALGDDD